MSDYNNQAIDKCSKTSYEYKRVHIRSSLYKRLNSALVILSVQHYYHNRHNALQSTPVNESPRRIITRKIITVKFKEKQYSKKENHTTAQPQNRTTAKHNAK